MTSKYIFCQCMKPWKLCVNKSDSYKLDSRGIIDIYRIKVPCLDDYKQSKNKQGNNKQSNNKQSEKQYNINYDFINMRPTKSKFVCRFSDKPEDKP
jgi:hypothetical protein